MNDTADMMERTRHLAASGQVTSAAHEAAKHLYEKSAAIGERVLVAAKNQAVNRGVVAGSLASNRPADQDPGDRPAAEHPARDVQVDHAHSHEAHANLHAGEVTTSDYAATVEQPEEAKYLTPASPHQIGPRPSEGERGE